MNNEFLSRGKFKFLRFVFLSISFYNKYCIKFWPKIEMRSRTARFVTKSKRLFKKIGVFELLIGFLILLVLVFIMIQARSKKEWIKAEIKISSSAWWQAYFTSPPFWLGESVKIGDSEFDSGGKKIAEVLDVKIYELSLINEFEATTRKDFYLTLNLQVDRSKRTGKIKFKNQPLEIGSSIELHLTNTYIPGLIVNIEGVDEEKEMAELVVEGIWLNVFPWSAEAIPIGGEMKDGMDNVVAKILDKQIYLSDIFVTTDDGRVLLRKDPLKRDVVIKAKILVKKQGENFYFREDQKVKIGENLFFHFPGVDVKWVSIKKIFDKDGKKIY